MEIPQIVDVGGGGVGASLRPPGGAAPATNIAKIKDPRGGR